MLTNTESNMFESKILALATSCGISRPYFFEGTMYASPDLVARGSLRSFVAEYRRQFRGDVLITKGREEVAVDFIQKPPRQ